MTEEHQDFKEDTTSNSQYEGNIRTVLNLSLVTFLVMLGLSMVAPILPVYAESFQVSYTLVGFVISSFAAARMFIDIPAGLLSRRYNKKKIMITGLVLLSTSSVLAGYAPSYIILVIARVIEGVGSALYVTTATVFLAQISGEEKRGQWMSLYLGTLLLGSIFGPTFGGVLADNFDIHMPFFAYALITGLGIIPTIALPNLTSSLSEIPSLNLKQVLQDMHQVISSPSFLSVTFAIFTMFFLRTGIRSTLVPLFAANNLGLSPGDIGLILTFGAIATAFTITPIGSISDKIGRKRPLAACLVLSAVSILFIHASFDMFTLSITIVVFGAVVGLSGPSAAYVTDLVPPGKLEISMGVYRTISDSGFFVGPLLLGFVADITATPVPGASHSGLIEMAPFALASVILMIALLVLIGARDPARESR